MRAKLILGTALVVALTLLVPAASAEPYGATIWNGDPSADGAHPAVVALLRPDSSSPVDCTGTLVAAVWVLTAAHCIYDTPAAPIEVGIDGISAREGFSEVFTSRLHVVHPQWNPRNVRYDIALIRLPAPSEVAPMRMAVATDGLAVPDAPAQIVGWGATGGHDRGVGRLREAQITLAENRACERVHRNFHAGSMLCGNSAEADACRGDSGGPLFAFAGEERIVLGVTSFGEDCDLSAVGVYANVPAVRGWIDEVTSADTIAPMATDAGLVPSTDRIRAGRSVTIRAGLFRYDDGMPLMRQKVEILRRPRGTTRWRVVARSTTNINGIVRLRDEPVRDMQYALRHRGSSATQASISPARTVRVVR